MNNRVLTATVVRRALVGITLITSLQHSYGQKISDQDASLIFVNASSNVFFATARVFDCLYEARQGKAGATRAAQDALEKAIMAYKRLADDRKNTVFNYGSDFAMTGAVDQINLIIASSPPPKWTSIRVLKSESDVAQLNIDSINELRNQLAEWKDCRKPSQDVKQYIAFIRNKINLELTSQIAEIAFKRK